MIRQCGLCKEYMAKGSVAHASIVSAQCWINLEVIEAWKEDAAAMATKRIPKIWMCTTGKRKCRLLVTRESWEGETCKPNIRSRRERLSHMMMRQFRQWFHRRCRVQSRSRWTWRCQGDHRSGGSAPQGVTEVVVRIR